MRRHAALRGKMVYLYDKRGRRSACYTTRQFARVAGITKRSVYNWIELGLPIIDLDSDEGGTILIPGQEAKVWVREMGSKGAIRKAKLSKRSSTVSYRVTSVS